MSALSNSAGTDSADLQRDLSVKAQQLGSDWLVFVIIIQTTFSTVIQAHLPLDINRLESRLAHPFFPPFLRDSAGVLGGEGERLLFLPAELALRSLRSGVRED